MWKKLKLLFFFERMVAFSVLLQHKVWILTHDRLFELDLVPEIVVKEIFSNARELDQLWDEKSPTGDFFNEDQCLLSLSGQSRPMLGLYGGVPLLQNARGEQLSLEPREERLVILTTDLGATLLR